MENEVPAALQLVGRAKFCIAFWTPIEPTWIPASAEWNPTIPRWYANRRSVFRSFAMMMSAPIEMTTRIPSRTRSIAPPASCRDKRVIHASLVDLCEVHQVQEYEPLRQRRQVTRVAEAHVVEPEPVRRREPLGGPEPLRRVDGAGPQGVVDHRHRLGLVLVAGVVRRAPRDEGALIPEVVSTPVLVVPREVHQPAAGVLVRRVTCIAVDPAVGRRAPGCVHGAIEDRVHDRQPRPAASVV